MERIEADADVPLAALLHKRDRCVEAVAERIGSAELQREPDAEARGPLSRLRQRGHCPAQRFSFCLLGEVGDEHERGNAELLAEVEPPAIVVEMGPALLSLGQEQSALVGRRRQGHAATCQELTRLFRRVLFQVLFGMWLALLLNVQSRFVEFARTFFLIPMVLPPIVVAVIWKLIYTPDISPIYYAASLLNVTMPALTSSVDFALISIIIADTWEWLPFTFLMVLAALQTIPDEFSEAALVDGASRIQIFYYVTLPFIAPILLVSVMFRLIDSVKAFPLIFLLTGGGPGSLTEVTNYYAYLLAFDTNEIGYSSTVTVVMLLLVAAISLGLVWMGRRREGLS